MMKNYAAAMPFRNRVSDILNLCAKLKYPGKNVKGTAGRRALLLSGILLCSGLAEAQTPTITSVSPYAGNAGAAVTITGTNFNTTAANNIVYFGAAQATVSSASGTSLSVTVPAGATFMPVTAYNTASSLTAFSEYSFLPTFSGGTGTFLFGQKVDFTTGSAPRAIAIADIDGDGKPDMIVSNQGSLSISVYRNTSTSGSITSGSFAAKIDFTIGGNPLNIAIGDIDGDGKPDIVVTNDGGYVSVLRNTTTSSTITLATKVNFTTGNNPIGVAIADIDGDGKADIVVANSNSANSAGVSLSGSLKVTGTYTPTSGILTTGGFLTLASNSSGTANVAQGSTSGAYVSGLN